MKTDTLISEYVHLKGFPREAEALQMLKKVASLVRPIMRQRGWRVGLLQEFYPPAATDGRHLLGLNENAGERISIRLREPFDKTQFLPKETVVETMLHELTHNVHGPHDEKFDALLQKLREEHEKLTRSGYTGEGFLSDGKVLGGKRIPLEEARRRARAAAEKRRDLTKGSGQKLGGGPIVPGRNIREVIVSAIERRKAVNQGCGMGHKDSKAIGDQATANGFRTQAEEDEANDRAIVQAYAELLQEEEKEKEKWGDSYIPRESPADSAYNQKPKAETPSPASRKRPQEVSPRNGRPISRLVGGSASGMKTPSQTGLSRERKTAATAPSWTCPLCTLENPLEHLSCDACMSERPASTYGNKASLPDDVVDSKKATLGESATEPARVAQWVCHRCGAYMDAQWWTCSLCGTMKLSS
ncbi:MAG: hypothetical protein M1840_003443 [Geoglossum simile]|nr:MAG: hypothetical protein M1840_003443 [Geoglossum simile]